MRCAQPFLHINTAMAYTDALAERILSSHEEYVGGPMTCQIHSYEEFMDYMLPLLVQEHSVIDVEAGGEKHAVRLHTVTVGAPTHKDPDGSVYETTPSTSRHAGLTYEAQVSICVKHTVQKAGEERVCEYVNLPLTYMPVMVKSRYCVARHESPDGGYFIVRGHEKVVQPQVRLRNNAILVFPVKSGGKHAVYGEVRSVHWLKLRSTSTLKFFVPRAAAGGFGLLFELPFLKLHVPLAALFRLLGVEDVNAMVQLVWPNATTPPPAGAMRLTQAALAHESAWLPLEQLHEWVERNGARPLTGAAKPPGWYASRLLSSELLPHLGTTDTEHVRAKKAAFVGAIARRMICVHVRAEPLDDRDDEANKRVSMVGSLMGLLFRQLMRRYVQTVRNLMSRTLEAGNKTLNLKTILTSKGMSADLRYAFGTGNWSAQRSTGTQVGVTQLLNHMSILSMQSALERVNTPMCREGKYTQMRQLHPTQWGIYCPDETPEGQACGLQKNFTRMAFIRGTVSEDLVAQSLLEVLPEAQPWEPGDAPPFLMLNGDLVGTFRGAAFRAPQEAAGKSVAEEAGTAVSASLDRLVEHLRELRRDGILYRYASFSRVPEGLCVTCDVGCVMRPLLVASRLHLLPRLMMEGGTATTTTIRTGSAPLFPALFRAGVIEYVDKQEEAGLRVAERLASAVDDGAGTFTHLEIHPIAILGRCASVIPNSDRNQAPRNMYQAAMAKQTVSIPCEDWMTRTEAMHVPWYPQKPMAKTLYEPESNASGCNAVVAILTYTGKNQEDSLIANKSAVERGLFRSTYFSVYKDVCNSGGGGGGVEEMFENPAASDTCVNLQHGNFEHLGPDGLPSPGTRIGPDDVVIGKTLTRNDSVRGVKADLSTRAKAGGVVDRVLLTQRDGMPAARVVLREMRIPEIGDKASSRHGQKGILGLLMPQEDMPFIASGPMAGITPDLIVNPHAITSRMTLGHLAESLQSLLGCVTGRQPNATPFQADAEKALESVSDQLHAAGFQRHGNMRMKNGMTGEDIEASVFCGVVYYQRLKHMVRDKIHARTRGPVNFLTRQPLEGRSRDGGQRFGEMERDAGVAHGASEFVADRLLHSTDPFLVPVCKLCGIIAEAAHDTAFGATVTGASAYCRACDSHDVATVSLPFASKLVLQELMSVGVGVRLRTE